MTEMIDYVDFLTDFRRVVRGPDPSNRLPCAPIGLTPDLERHGIDEGYLEFAEEHGWEVWVNPEVDCLSFYRVPGTDRCHVVLGQEEFDAPECAVVGALYGYYMEELTQDMNALDAVQEFRDSVVSSS